MGSEMCIRDRAWNTDTPPDGHVFVAAEFFVGIPAGVCYVCSCGTSYNRVGVSGCCTDVPDGVVR